jgi:hypothetical protein
MLVERTGYDMTRLEAAHALPGWEVCPALRIGTPRTHCSRSKEEDASRQGGETMSLRATRMGQLPPSRASATRKSRRKG